MAKPLSEEESFILKEEAMIMLNNYLNELQKSEIEKPKSDKISYWIKDWVRYQRNENDFKPEKIGKFKRGSVIKVNLGFNIGSEEGGLHYAIVLDKNNSMRNKVITIIPLTSVKDNKDINNLPNDQVYLGNEIINKLTDKQKLLLSTLSDIDLANADENTMSNFDKDLRYAKRIQNELEKMKLGSIALVGQITTVSKMKIFDPKNKYGVLKNVRISNDSLDKIDKKIKENFFK
ncbi:type II toxin-antitoxin system PemK/MazF family toxin [Streptococcus dysgalactiae subsp. dysgalactiae]|uniref:type II toxin-antitoxin system PemK/MazF family toxin n=2 Tax=Streptococcus dysgalactiae TaxID=1334 RepID=UPI001CF42203|nr:type II toxin-antitoxin system PemK/MazF family toxin [Streptococcus dysgalactiae]MCB2830318.1 type II toxin-antitoxin system PemK/MazF family toxin [Streptococcus dysgalactiae subsp. dysgalactiae]MCB2843785.1 type II toxin-antitoxin system PemK/MazF family toxin [Streptococcus dysgalactiae subsp. dysgalactiae]MCB2847675.1 type II toxin-antitoxin system PemK/MazF family toxin [Streptococcus dysgalactiae subsp. dysgalactiae]MCB2849480.1 type II toxin-antitoxin system PemK/MazF family toxin [S